MDEAGTVVERYDYNPYGQRIVLNADFTADADGLSDLGNPVGHQGLMHDAESGLVYNRARMLNPTLGRFMQRDPLGYVDGMRLYEYVRNNPLSNSDWRGLLLMYPGRWFDNIQKQIGGWFENGIPRTPNPSGGPDAFFPAQQAIDQARLQAMLEDMMQEALCGN